jgi:hypothetical protein
MSWITRPLLESRDTVLEDGLPPPSLRSYVLHLFAPCPPSCDIIFTYTCAYTVGRRFYILLLCDTLGICPVSITGQHLHAAMLRLHCLCTAFSLTTSRVRVALSPAISMHISKRYRPPCSGNLTELTSALEWKKRFAVTKKPRRLLALIRKHDARPKRDRRIILCDNLAGILWARWQNYEDQVALAACIEIEAELLNLHDHADPDRARRCSNLVVSLQAHLVWTAESRILWDVVGLQRKVLILRPPGHADRHIACANLASSLWELF